MSEMSRTRERTTRPRRSGKALKRGLGVLATVGVVGYGGYKLNEMDKQNERRVATEEALRAVEAKRVTGVESQVLFFREGVKFRTDPHIFEDQNGGSNAFYTVPKGKAVRVEHAVKMREGNDSYFMFAFLDGDEERVAFVSNDVTRQVDGSGDDYVIRFGESTDDITEFEPGDLKFNPDTNTFSTEAQQFGPGQEMSIDEAFRSMAQN